MPRGQPITDEQKELVAARLKEDRPYREIAKEVGLHFTSVGAIAKEIGHEVDPHRRRQVENASQVPALDVAYRRHALAELFQKWQQQVSIALSEALTSSNLPHDEALKAFKGWSVSAGIGTDKLNALHAALSDESHDDSRPRVLVEGFLASLQMQGMPPIPIPPKHDDS